MQSMTDSVKQIILNITNKIVFFANVRNYSTKENYIRNQLMIAKRQ
jgi:hypothetical protein